MAVDVDLMRPRRHRRNAQAIAEALSVPKTEFLIDVEELQIGKSKDGKEAVAKDREVVGTLEITLKALKEKPQGFNGPAGFMFFQWLDDAGRNAVLCSSYASSQVAMQIMAGNVETTPSVIDLGQSCSEVSALLYTVSESVGSLYEKYVEAEDELARRGAETLDKCVAILKKNSERAVPKGKL
jgi:hypothetical protein